jgi:hypothetical protein
MTKTNEISGDTTTYIYNTNQDVYSILKEASNLGDLQLHDNTIPTMTYDEIVNFEESHIYDADEINDIQVKIDDSKYRDTSFYKDNLNTLESKSHIYHKMLNSIEYYNTAEGDLTMVDEYNTTYSIEYQCNVKTYQSYTHTLSSDINGYTNEDECYIPNDGTITTVDNLQKTYTIDDSIIQMDGDIIVPDNYKVIVCSDTNDDHNTQRFNFNRKDSTKVGIAGSISLFPQNLAITYLQNFDTWNVTAIETYLGRNCLILEDTQGSFKFYVDINTGILLSYEFSNGSKMETNHLQLDSLSNIKQFSTEDYPNYTLETY